RLAAEPPIKKQPARGSQKMRPCRRFHRSGFIATVSLKRCDCRDARKRNADKSNALLAAALPLRGWRAYLLAEHLEASRPDSGMKLRTYNRECLRQPPRLDQAPGAHLGQDCDKRPPTL